MKTILLTFDVEEADLLRNEISKEEEFEISKNGLTKLLKLLNKRKIKATFFTTANFAKKYPPLIRKIKKLNHEIACHGFYHSDCYSKEKDFCNIKPAKQEIEKIIKTKIHGFRAPRFDIKEISRISDFGFLYDSSIHPTFVPGRYMNLFTKRKSHKIKEIIEIPPSTLPICRLPIAWIFFRNLGLSYAKTFTKINFLFSDYTMLIFHPWEFANLKKFNIPRYIKRNHGEALLKMIEKYILFCKKNNYQFKTVEDYLQI